MSEFLNKIPVSPITSFGNPSVPNGATFGTNFSILQTGGYMEVYTLSGLTYTIPPATTGIIEFSGNSIPIQLSKGSGSVFSPDVLTLNSDNISSGRRKLGMLAYVYETNKIYQFRIDNYDTLWNNATGATGPGGPTVVISDFGTTVKNNSLEGQLLIDAWTASTISGVDGYNDTNASWRVLQTGGSSSGGTSITGGTFNHGTETLSLYDSNGGTVTITGFTDINVTGGTYSDGTITFTNNTGGTFNVEGLFTGATDVFVTGGTYSGGTIIFTNNTGGTFNVEGLFTGATDVFVTGGTYSAGTTTFTNNTGGTFNVSGYFTGQTDNYITGGTFDKNTETLSLYDLTGGTIIITGFTDVFVTGGTYSGETIIFTNNTGGTFNVSGVTTQFTGGTVTGATNFTNGLTANTISASTYLNLPKIQYIINVAKSGGDFTSIKDAVDSISDSNNENRYVVKVAPGRYVEDEIVLQGKEFVSIVGTDILETLVVASNPNQNIFTMGNNNELSFMTISGASNGVGILCYNLGGFSLVHKISMYDCNTNVLVQSDSADSNFYGEYMDFNGAYSYGTRVLAYNGYVAYANVENYYNYPTGPNPTIANSIQGDGATLSVFVGDGIGNGNSDSINYEIIDNASLNTTTTTAEGWGYCLRNPNIGNGCRFDIDSLSVINSINYDIFIENSDTFGTFNGSSTHTKINSISPNIYWSFLDSVDGEFEITRKISVTFQDGTHTDMSTLIFEGGTMGLISGGTISVVSGLTINILEGFGYLEKTISEEIYPKVYWPTTDVLVPQNINYYLYVNENGIISVSGTRPDSINNIVLGRVVTNSSTVSFIDASPLNSDHTSNRFSNLFRDALGPIFASGSIVTEGITPFTLDVTGGNYYFSTNQYLPTGGTGLTFNQYYNDGLGGWNISATTLVNNTQFDNNGVLSGLTSSAYTKHTLYLVGEGVNEKYFLVLGQNQYQTLVETENALLPIPPTFFSDSVTQLASIYVRQGLTNIVQIEDIRPVIGFKAGGVNASSLHANLLGLTADDHKQYLLVDGSRAMSNNLNMGGNAILSAGTINGVTIQSHASRHKNGGDDEVATSTPGPSEIPKADTFGKLDSWISDASSTVKGLTKLSVNPLSASTPIAVGVNDTRFLKSITGVTNTSGSLRFSNNSGETTIFSGLNITNVTATTISATTYLNLPTDIRVTGGTYSSGGTLTFRNNTGGTFNVTGLYTGGTDIYVDSGTIINGPGADNNKILLHRTDGNYVAIDNLVEIVDITKFDIDSLISNKNVIRGKTYKISGCDTSLYYYGNDGKKDVYTTIYLLGLERNKLSENGIGIFYTPKYNSYSIFVDGNTYLKNDYVIWGGFVWMCNEEGTYTSIDIFTLPTEFTIQYPFDGSEDYNNTFYNIQYDDIIYDYVNDRIIYRNEENSNIVSTSYDNINYWINDKGYYNPIRVFQWGHLDDGAGVGVIYNQQIINSYNENINYTGLRQNNFYFNNLSYQKTVLVSIDSYQSNFTFDNKSYQLTIDILDSSYQDNIVLNNLSYQQTISISVSSYQQYLILDNNSYQKNITLLGSTRVSSQSYFNFNNSSLQEDISLSEKEQSYFDFTNNSGQQIIINCNQRRLIFDGGFQSNGSLITQEQITIKGYNRDLTSVFSSELGEFYIQDLPTDNTAPVYIGKINNRLVQVTKPTDIFVTGGTYSSGTGIITFRNNSGGTFTVSGITSGGGGTFTGGTVTGNTNFTSGVTANTISATTYLNLPTDIRVTGGTYSLGSLTFTNNTGGTFNVTGLYTGATDVFVTGGTYSSGSLTFTNNTGGTFNVTGLYTGATDVFVTGGTYSNGTAIFTNNTGGTFNVSGLTTPFTGGTVVGDTNFTSGVTANTISATTYYNLPATPFLPLSGGTVTGTTIIKINGSSFQIATSNYSPGSVGNVILFTTNTGITYSTINSRGNGGTGNSDLILQNSGGNVGIGTNTAPNFKLDVGGSFGATSVSATTYYNLPTDIFVTGGTYSGSTIVFTNNTGGTFNVTGITTSSAFTGGTVTGATNFTGGLTANTISATTITSPSISPYGLIVATSLGYQNIF